MPKKVLALGDSVVWGQGLKEPNKFVEQARKLVGSDAELASLAHSGAIIDLKPLKAEKHSSFLFGELPRGLPGILSQIEIAAGNPDYASYLKPNSWDLEPWQALKKELARQIAGYATKAPDVILLDGGINDFNAFQIVVPWSIQGGEGKALGIAGSSGASNVARVLEALDEAEADQAPAPKGAAAAPQPAAFALPDLHWLTDDEFRALIDKIVYERMRLLLRTLGSKPRFKASRVVVTGYFPIFTAGSVPALMALNPALATLMVSSGSRDEQRAALATALQYASTDPQKYTNIVVRRSQIWYEHSAKRLGEAVQEANGKFGNRFAFASPVFGPDNGALAPKSFLWTFTGAVDDVLKQILRWLGQPAPAAAAAGKSAAAAAPLGGVDFGVGYGLGAGIATDEAITQRGQAAFAYYLFSSTGRQDPAATFFGGFKTSVASAGHPTPQGAKAYTQAIKKVL
jgi:hypothetical protein